MSYVQNFKIKLGAFLTSFAGVLTADRQYTFPDKAGTFALLSDVGGSIGTKKVVTDAGYTITDIDGHGTIEVSTGATNRVVVLPTLADNLNRTLKLVKSDAGVGKATFDGEGTEKINWGVSFLTISCLQKGDTITVFGGETEWIVIGGTAANWKPFTESSGVTDYVTNTYFKRIGDMVCYQFSWFDSGGFTDADVIATVPAEFRPTGSNALGSGVAILGGGAEGNFRMAVYTSGNIVVDFLPNTPTGNTLLFGSMFYRVSTDY